MKFFNVALLAGLAASTPVCSGCTRSESCSISVFNGVVTPDVTSNTLLTEAGIKDAEVCRAKCFSTAYPSCKAFGIRSSGQGACRLWDYEVFPRATREGEAPSTYFYYSLPGIVGWVPENVAQHYRADITKTKGNYAGCRGLCLSETRCKGFGFKQGGNCQLYDVSLTGKVKANADSPYIHYSVDCTAAPYS